MLLNRKCNVSRIITRDISVWHMDVQIHFKEPRAFRFCKETYTTRKLRSLCSSGFHFFRPIYLLFKSEICSFLWILLLFIYWILLDDELSYPFSTLSPPCDHHRNQGRHLEGMGAFPWFWRETFFWEKEKKKIRDESSWLP